MKLSLIGCVRSSPQRDIKDSKARWTPASLANNLCFLWKILPNTLVFHSLTAHTKFSLAAHKPRSLCQLDFTKVLKFSCDNQAAWKRKGLACLGGGSTPFLQASSALDKKPTRNRRNNNLHLPALFLDFCRSPDSEKIVVITIRQYETIKLS